jgi:ABC-type lipoprotein release transport system permease subunit
MLFFINQFAILESWFSWKHSYFNFLIIQHICYIYSMLSVVTILRKMPAIGIYLILSSNKILGISALVTLGRLFNNFINENLKTINEFNPKIKIYSNETARHNGNMSYLNDVADSIKNSFSSQLADYKVMLYVIQNNYIIFFLFRLCFF